jgi:hypothetical protein
MEVILWLNLVGCTVVFLILGMGVGDDVFDNKIIGALLGIVVGILVGLVTCVLYGGLLALFLNLCKDIKNMNKWLQYMWEHKINTDANQKTPMPLYDEDVHYFADSDEPVNKDKFIDDDI